MTFMATKYPCLTSNSPSALAIPTNQNTLRRSLTDRPTTHWTDGNSPAAGHQSLLTPASASFWQADSTADPPAYVHVYRWKSQETRYLAASRPVVRNPVQIPRRMQQGLHSGEQSRRAYLWRCRRCHCAGNDLDLDHHGILEHECA